MHASEILTQLDIESVKRLKPTYGLFDVTSLAVRYNYTFDEYTMGAQFLARQEPVPEVIKTAFHEVTHLYQMLSTPYGYYYYILKQFQANQVAALMKLLRENYSIKVQYPLVDVISRLLPKEKYHLLWGNLYLWYLAEVMLLFMEGNVDVFLKQMLYNRFLGARPVITIFMEMESYLTRFCEHIGQRFSYERPNIEVADDSIKIEKLLITLKATGDLDVMALLESAAKIAEFWGSPVKSNDDFLRQFPDSMPASRIKYYALIDIAKSRIKAANIREFVLTYAALCDLALFAPLLPHYYKIRNSQITMKDINPIFRFMDASSSASGIEPIHNLTTDYTRFIEQICEKMRWPTPQQVAGATLSNFTYAPLDRLSELYHRAQEFRMVMPWVFIDYSVWYLPKSEITAPFTYYFIHPIIELKDKTLFHKDKMLVSYFVLQYVVQQYLRKILLCRDISVMLPYRANFEETNFYREILETYLYTTMGIKNPPITLLAAT